MQSQLTWIKRRIYRYSVHVKKLRFPPRMKKDNIEEIKEMIKQTNTFCAGINNQPILARH